MRNRLPCPSLLPLIIAGRWDDTAAVFVSIAESRLSARRLRTRIDRFESDLRIVRPSRDEPPGKPMRFGARIATVEVVADGKDRLARSNIVARRNLGNFIQVESIGDFNAQRCDDVATARDGIQN